MNTHKNKNDEFKWVDWLATNVHIWNDECKFLIRHTITEHGYYFANETSVKEKLTKAEWVESKFARGFITEAEGADIMGVTDDVPKPVYVCGECGKHYDNDLDLCPQCHTPAPHAESNALPDVITTDTMPEFNDPTEERNTKYDREIVGLCGTKVMVDVYRVLDAYPTTNPQVQHLIKKGLATGQRGHKTRLQDLIDIRDSINSAIVMEQQKNG